MPAGLGDLESRLRNWGRAMRVPRSDGNGQAYSIEGDFRRRSEEEEAFDEAPPSKGPAPDYGDAWDVEVAVCVLMINEHLLLKLRYVLNWDDDAVTRNWRRLSGSPMPRRLLPRMDESARMNLRHALALPQVVRKHRALVAVRRVLKIALDLEKVRVA